MTSERSSAVEVVPALPHTVTGTVKKWQLDPGGSGEDVEGQVADGSR
ncbi:hypothetical protein SAMN05443575_3385 [Jatrophihabitans endophyticus]|uniref:Uncharacterized protein n=1 Tax=Jatrophihabitans endophyticus TaxID=1206085 RepID=A0A1M5QYG4_9ACTN|nr:hypothetical protein [Jatrophihabitans endophyticus]SHH18810.1 hypothetical protein SAMN05443575_3385 [Jatrophihabitans endophyticus]